MTDDRKTLSIRPGGSRVPDLTDSISPTSQLSFLTGHAFLYEHAAMAESLALADPRGSAMRSRLGVEAMVRWLYDHDASLRSPYETSLNALTAEPTFRKLVGTMIGTVVIEASNVSMGAPATDRASR